ncbi:MAG TPA: hypothetical protein VMB79_17225 [Jatrophihabitans sp.]|nr:hypothetical protein [Jatrophihabitans sp.]
MAMLVCMTLAYGVAKSRPNLRRLQRRDPEAAERLAQQLIDEQRYGRSIGTPPSALRGLGRRRY